MVRVQEYVKGRGWVTMAVRENMAQAQAYMARYPQAMWRVR